MFSNQKPLQALDIPFRGEIESSFGSGYSLEAVQALSGPAIESAAGRLGAVAFTQGDVMGFAQPPTLHDAAHEAAHIFQQRHGLSLFDGYADHEDHADAVADRVVAGESARDLLPVSGPPSTAVQCKKTSSSGAKKAAAPEPVSAVARHAADPKVLADLEARMAAAREQQELAKNADIMVSMMQWSGLASPETIEAAKNRAANLHSQVNQQRNAIIKDTASAYGIDLSGIDSIRYSTLLGEDTAATTYAKGDLEGEKDKDRVVVRIGEAAFNSPDEDKQDSPGYLAAIIGHEAFHAQNQMTADGKWKHPNPSRAQTALDEVAAYDDELDAAAKYGLTKAEIERLKRERTDHFNLLNGPTKQSIVEDGAYVLKKE